MYGYNSESDDDDDKWKMRRDKASDYDSVISEDPDVESTESRVAQWVAEATRALKGKLKVADTNKDDPFYQSKHPAFFLHDDRFTDVPVFERQDKGKNLSGFEDEGKWKHDKFKEMTERSERWNEEERRNFESSDQGHQNLGSGRNKQGLQSNRSFGRGYMTSKQSSLVKAKNDNQSGKGKQPEVSLKIGSAREYADSSNVDPKTPAIAKHDSTVPRISPTGFSNRDISQTWRPGRGRQYSVSANREVSTTHNFQQKPIGTGFVQKEKFTHFRGRGRGSLPSGSHQWIPKQVDSVSKDKFTHFRGRGRGSLPSGSHNYQWIPKQVDSVSQMAQNLATPQPSVESTVQLPLQIGTQESGPRSPSELQAPGGTANPIEPSRGTDPVNTSEQQRFVCTRILQSLDDFLLF
ncbi:hypothetical protein ACFE04_018288 [Oxalis oulophora]